STSSSARASAEVSVMLALMKSISPPISLRFSSLPVERSSITRTRAPCSLKAEARCEPIKPAPPVTRAIPERGMFSALLRRIQNPSRACRWGHRYCVDQRPAPLSSSCEFCPCREPGTDSIQLQTQGHLLRSRLRIHQQHTQSAAKSSRPRRGRPGHTRLPELPDSAIPEQFRLREHLACRQSRA